MGQVKKEEEKERRLVAQAEKKAVTEEEKRQRIISALKRERETKDRADAALRYYSLLTTASYYPLRSTCRLLPTYWPLDT